MLYKQCELLRGNEATMIWIPEEFALPGKIIKLKYEEGAPWTVEWVGTLRLTEEQIAVNEGRFYRDVTAI